MRVRDPQNLRRWRQRRGLSQRDLAYLCRCSQATISLLERGAMRTLSENLGLQLSARLQVPWEELFEDEPGLPVTGLRGTSNHSDAAIAPPAGAGAAGEPPQGEV